MDRLRAQPSPAFEQKSLFIEAGTQHIDTGPSPEQAYQQAELKTLIESFLGTIGPEEKKLIELRYEQHLSQEEVACRLKKTRRFVRSKELDLRQRFFKHLDHTGYLPSQNSPSLNMQKPK